MATTTPPLPKTAAKWVLAVDARAVLAIARKKEEEGGSDFQGGLTGFGAQPNFQRKLPDGRVQTHTVIPKLPDYEVGNHHFPVFEPDNLSDVLDDQLEVFLRGFRLGVNALAVEN